MARPPRIFIVSGPSGSGKSTLVETLLKEVPGTMFSVSYTTRRPRSNEEEGREYHFVSREEFEKMVTRSEFLEWANVYGHFYGTHQRYVALAEQQGKDLVLDIDVQGARQVKQRIPEAIAIFLVPPSRPELERRIRSRGLDAEEAIRRRLEQARVEIENCRDYDYIVINEDLERAKAEVRSIAEAERCRAATRDGRLQFILESFGGQGDASR